MAKRTNLSFFAILKFGKCFVSVVVCKQETNKDNRKTSEV